MTTEKKLTEKQRLINEVLLAYKDDSEFNKHFTRARLDRGFTVGMLKHTLEVQNGTE